MQRREAGFSFIEILIVIGIIAVLASAVAVIVPRAQEASRQTQSSRNVQQILQLMTMRRAKNEPWARFNGKNFVLSVVATGDLDYRNPDQLTLLFSPGDGHYALDEVKERYGEVTPKSLKDGDFRALTSYAGRRNADRDYMITPAQEQRIVPVICDDDDGPLHHPKGLIVGNTDASVKFLEWHKLDMQPPANPDSPDPFLGDRAQNDLLRALSSD